MDMLLQPKRVVFFFTRSSVFIDLKINKYIYIVDYLCREIIVFIPSTLIVWWTE